MKRSRSNSKHQAKSVPLEFCSFVSHLWMCYSFESCLFSRWIFDLKCVTRRIDTIITSILSFVASIGWYVLCLMLCVSVHSLISHFICNSLLFLFVIHSFEIFFLFRNKIFWCFFCVCSYGCVSFYLEKWIYVGIQLKYPDECAFVRVIYGINRLNFLLLCFTLLCFSTKNFCVYRSHNAILCSLLVTLLIALALFQSVLFCQNSFSTHRNNL